jgi:transposase
LAEFGRIAAQGLHKLALSIAIVRNEADERVPDMARLVPRVIADGIVARDAQIAIIEAEITAWHRSNPMSQRVVAIPGIGPIIATVIAAAGCHSRPFPPVPSPARISVSSSFLERLR